MGSTTRMVRSASLVQDKEIASVVLRLMMAMNDIGVANDALQEWDQTENPKKKARQNGGRLYFGRMQMAHIYEGLLIVEDISKTSKLKAAVDRCDTKTRRSFDEIAKFLNAPDYKILARIRNNVSFHYDGKLAVRALEQIATKYPSDVSPLSLGHETLDWYFELGDKVFDRVVVRDIFKVGEDVDMRSAINAVLHRLHLMAAAFSDFAGYFIRHYAK
jgi:hypothetical protein